MASIDQNIMSNHQMFMGSFNACNFCDEQFGPPPDDILYIPPPPLPLSVQSFLMPQRDLTTESEATTRAIDSKCSYCSVFDNPDFDPSVDTTNDHYISQSKTGLFLIAAIFLASALITIAYLSRTRKVKMFASQVKGSIFGSGQTSSSLSSQNSAGSPRMTMPNHASHPTDPCLMPMNLEKTLSSPNIITDVPHKKTSIPSKYWAQPGTMRAGSQIGRIPNDYEIPSSRTNSTCTSSAVYADLTNKAQSQARLFSPYNMHTYAEVVEPSTDMNNQPSKQVVMIPDSNYDNAVYSHGSIVTSNGIIGPNGSLQLTDFGSVRNQSMTGPFMTAANHHLQHHNMHLGANMQPNQRPFATLHQQQQQNQQHHMPQQRAQIIVTSNSQGCGPSLLNYEERMRDVI